MTDNTTTARSTISELQDARNDAEAEGARLRDALASVKSQVYEADFENDRRAVDKIMKAIDGHLNG